MDAFAGLGRGYLAAVGAVLALYLGLSIGLSLTRLPICDEGWYTSPTLSLMSRQGMGSPVLESAGNYLKGIEQYTYWVMPVHALIQAPWFELFGASLISSRMLSVAAGLIALICWWYVIGSVTADFGVALLALFLMAIDSTILVSASTGRSDMLSAAFGAAALALYLGLRQKHLGWAVFAGHSMAVASGLTHPNGGLMAVPSLLFLLFYLDRQRLRWMHLAAGALPYLVAGAAWSVYIFRSPESFWAQFSGNSAGRLWPLKAPFTALRREITDRWLLAYGIAPGARRVGMLRALVLLVYFAGAGGLLTVRSIRRTPAARIVGALIAIVLLVLVFLEGAKQPWYLIHLTWLLASALALVSLRLDTRRRVWGVLRVGTLAGVMLIECGYAAGLIAERKYERVYKPMVAALNQVMQPGQSVIGSAELGFGLGFDRVKDDQNLGYYSGRRADFIAIDSNYQAHLAELKRRNPAVYVSLRQMLASAYRPVYSNPSYAVYGRVAGATP